MVPSGAITSNGRKSPSLEGASGAVMALKIVLQADINAPRAQLMGPCVCGALPVKSAVSRSGVMVTRTWTGIGSSLMPSPSMSRRLIDTGRNFPQCIAGDCFPVCQDGREGLEGRRKSVAVARWPRVVPSRSAPRRRRR